MKNTNYQNNKSIQDTFWLIVRKKNFKVAEKKILT
jgi:hypothetical protein